MIFEELFYDNFFFHIQIVFLFSLFIILVFVSIHIILYIFWWSQKL